jgi:Ala-tRNA(Pro) deacylase
MPLETLKKFLDSKKVKYVVISHSPAFTAQEIAEAAHVPGREMAKTVVVRLDKQLAMAVLPAPQQVDFRLLAEVAGADEACLATEAQFRYQFPKCEVGAMPPFGNLYDMPVYVDESLSSDEQIAFNAGSHKELIRLSFKDFKRTVSPEFGKFARGS